MPKLNKELLEVWLRSFFDCEGWVTCQSHKNRMIVLDCVNKEGLEQIKQALDKLNIECKIKKRTTRNTHTLAIYGKENLIRFEKNIYFLHPSKKEKLKIII